MNDFSNEGRDSQACRAVTEAVVFDLWESWLVRIASMLLLVLLITSLATRLPPVVVLELFVQAARNHPVEAAASFLGVLGTLLLATRTRWAGWGFLAFLGSNAGWLWFSIAHEFQWMFWQQVAFTISSLVGIWFWLVKARA